MKKENQIVPSWVLLMAAVFAFIAIADLPYGYYRFLRWAVCAVAVVSAFQMHRMKRQGWVWILGVVAILFNPFISVHFEKATWRVLDAATGVVFLCVLRARPVL
jgi:hypothetical protein